MSRRQFHDGQVRVVHEQLAIVCDMLSELSATLVDLELRGDFRDQDSLVTDKIARVLLEVWKVRWEVGPDAGDVATDMPIAVDESNGAEHTNGSAEA